MGLVRVQCSPQPGLWRLFGVLSTELSPTCRPFDVRAMEASLMF